jgi:hypothetical protein
MDSTKNLVTSPRNYSKICIALQSYSLFEIFDNNIYMKTAKLPKSEAGKVDESNLGHTKDEWGNQEDTPKIRFIVGYDVKWNIDKKNGEPN